MSDNEDLPTWEFTYGTKEFVSADLVSHVEDQLIGQTVGQPVEMRISPLTWQTGVWVSDPPGQEATVRTLVRVDFATLSRSILHPVYVRFTDTPPDGEVPIIKVGYIQVTA